MMSPTNFMNVLAGHNVAPDLRWIGTGVGLTVDGVALGYDAHGWHSGAVGVRSLLDHDATLADVKAEIRRVLAIVNAPAADPSPTRAEIKADCVGPDLPGDDRAQDRLTDEIDRRRDAAQALAKMTDAHAVVSQRLIGSQKEVATLTAQHDDWQADIDRARRDANEATARADKIEDRLRRDDEMREQIAVAVGLDGSASLARILDTVTRDRPVRAISRLSGLLDVLAAPVAFGERRLSTAERAEWALRRAISERDEVAPRMAQLIDAEVCLDVLGVPAYAAVPSDEPGDASEALTVAERIRLHFGARKDP